MKLDGYIQVKMAKGKPSIVAHSMRRPTSPQPGAVVLRLRLDLPSNVFAPLEAVGKVPEENVIRVVRVDE